MRTWIMLLITIFLISGCKERDIKNDVVSNTQSSWAYNLIVYGNKIYTVSEKEIKPDKIRKEIGEIEYYSTEEKEKLKNNFSNLYKEGTKIYEIEGVDINRSIAVKTEDGRYIESNFIDNNKS